MNGYSFKRHEKLENARRMTKDFAKFYRDKGRKRGHCQSAEWRYNNGYGMVRIEACEPLCISSDNLTALLVDVWPLLPAMHRKLIESEYRLYDYFRQRQSVRQVLAGYGIKCGRNKEAAWVNSAVLSFYEIAVKKLGNNLFIM